jgi:hypothetical protein
MATDGELQPAGQRHVPDAAVLTLYRCGRRWVVAIVSPRLSVDVALHGSGDDPDAVIEEILCRVGDACPEVAISSECESESETEGPEGYEWRLELSRHEARAGDLGLSVFAALARDRSGHGAGVPRRPVRARGCPRPRSSRAMCRPLRF